MHPVRTILLLLLALACLPAVEAGSAKSAAAAAAARRNPPPRASAARVAAAPGFGAIHIAAVTRSTADGDVPRYGRFECRVDIDFITATNFYEPDPARGGVDLRAEFTAPDGRVWTIPGFYDGADFRIRFAPDRIGAWSFRVLASDSSGTAISTGGAFACGASASHGWVRVDGRWLRHADGTRFTPVGHNMGYQDDIEAPAFADLAAGAAGTPRLVSFWLSQPWTSGAQDRALIEQSPGSGALNVVHYEQAPCTFIDGVVERAEAAGVYLLPSIWIHDQLRNIDHPWDDTGDWDNDANPYRYDAAGADPIEFFRRSDAGGTTAQWRRQQAFLRYLTARWGYSAAIAGWVGVVELNGTNGGVSAPTLVDDWTQAVNAWFIANDPYRASAGTHPIAFSVTDSTPLTTLVSPSTWSMRGIDSYDAEDDDVAIAATIAGEALAAGASRPVLFTEFGGDLGKGATQPEHLHNGAWASWMAGAAMPALLWCDGANFINLNDAMQAELNHLAAFLALQSWSSEADQASAAASLGGRAADVRGWSRRLGDRGALWLQRHTGTADLQGATVSVGATNGRYARWWFDTRTGVESEPSIVTVTDNQLPLVAPSSANADLAVSWQRYPVASDYATSAAQGSRLRLTLAPSAPQVLVTSLPAHGRVYQAVDASTVGPEITTVPTLVSDAGHRIFFDAASQLETVTVGYAIQDARLQGGAAISIQVVEYVAPPEVDGDGNPVERVPAHGCGAGGLAGLGVLMLAVSRLRRRR